MRLPVLLHVFTDICAQLGVPYMNQRQVSLQEALRVCLRILRHPEPWIEQILGSQPLQSKDNPPQTTIWYHEK